MENGLAVFWDGLKRALGGAADLILVNFLVILCCVPVITAGAAWVAGYAALMRVARGEDQGMPLAPFFRDFRGAFRQATAAWGILLLALLVLAGDYYYAVYVASPVNRFFLVFSIALAAVVLMAATWLFPLMARYDNALKTHVKNAFLMAAAELPRTLMALMAQALFVALPLVVPAVFVYFGWLWVLWGAALPMYLTVKLYRKRLGNEPPPNSGED
jgi:uncharacterized membrane protein YesL